MLTSIEIIHALKKAGHVEAAALVQELADQRRRQAKKRSG